MPVRSRPVFRGALALGLLGHPLLDLSAPRRLALAFHGRLPELALRRVLVVGATAKSQVLDRREAAARDRDHVVVLEAHGGRAAVARVALDVHVPPSRCQTAARTAAGMWRPFGPGRCCACPACRWLPAPNLRWRSRVTVAFRQCLITWARLPVGTACPGNSRASCSSSSVSRSIVPSSRSRSADSGVTRTCGAHASTRSGAGSAASANDPAAGISSSSAECPEVVTTTRAGAG
jgi:hypothetical protein